jgi:transcriptional regulator
MATPKADLLQGTLDLMVLRLLRRGELNGWDVTQAIRTISNGILDVTYGSVYPALRRLESRGLVRGTWSTSDNNRRARYYVLTPAGRKRLVTERAQWERFALAVGLILESD